MNIEIKDLLERLANAFERNNELLEKILGERSEQLPKANIMRLSEAWKELGFKNYHQCWRSIKKNHYRIGYEVIDRRGPNDADPVYWLDIEKCRKRDREIPARKSA